MSFFSSLFVFLFCLSIHLCSARHFGVLFHKGSATQIPFSSKGSVEEGKTDDYSIVEKSHGGAITQKAKESEAAVKEVKYVGKGAVPRINSFVWVSWRVHQKIHEGSELLGFSCHMGLLKTAKIEGSRRQPRSILEYASGFKDETIDSNNNDSQDARVMDYEPPHGTPPIHNKQT